MIHTKARRWRTQHKGYKQKARNKTECLFPPPLVPVRIGEGRSPIGTLNFKTHNNAGKTHEQQTLTKADAHRCK